MEKVIIQEEDEERRYFKYCIKQYGMRMPLVQYDIFRLSIPGEEVIYHLTFHVKPLINCFLLIKRQNNICLGFIFIFQIEHIELHLGVDAKYHGARICLSSLNRLELQSQGQVFRPMADEMGLTGIFSSAREGSMVDIVSKLLF